MTHHEVEMEARAALRRSKNGQQPESSAIELKADWTDQNDYRKAARQLAGLANAAHGEPIIWVVGVDEPNRVVLGVNNVELANWLPKIKLQFDSISPVMLHNVPFEFDGKTVVALCFETSRAPYVIKLINSGPVEREIPWREGNKTRSAFRDEILTMLIPSVTCPEFEIREGILAVGRSGTEGATLYVFAARLTLYVKVVDERKLHAPHHHIRMTATFPGAAYESVDFDKWDSPMRGEAYDMSKNIRDDGSQITVNGPGFLIIERSGFARFKDAVPEDVDVAVAIAFNETGGRETVAHARFVRPDPNKRSRTTLGGRQIDTLACWEFQNLDD